MNLVPLQFFGKLSDAGLANFGTIDFPLMLSTRHTKPMLYVVQLLQTICAADIN